MAAKKPVPEQSVAPPNLVGYQISLDGAKALLDYCLSRPYGEVHHLVGVLTGATPVFDPPVE